jgi:predicted nuclease of predicted toxin-antitoxin system
MRFLVDECTGPSAATWLRERGYEVYSVFDEVPGTDDLTILQKAWQEDWILITNDKDFGERVFREQLPHHGVVLLRLRDERPAAKIQALRKLLENHANELHGRFVVVTESAVRFSATP